MKIVWSSDAIEMADYFFEVTRHMYGQKIYQKYLDKIDTIQKQLSIMPRIVTLEPALADEDGEYRFRLINDRFKLIYRIVDEDNILIFAVWDMKQDPNKLRLFI